MTPGFLRDRDRAVFRDLARERGVLIVLQRADAADAEFVGDDSFVAAPWDLQAFPRREAPNRGVWAADPADRRFTTLETEGAWAPGVVSWHRVLAECGWHVCDADKGFVVEDGVHRRCFTGYRLLAVRSGRQMRGAWSAQAGEAMRATLNRRLGYDFVADGPWDTFEQAGTFAALCAGSNCFGAHFFHANGSIDSSQGLVATRDRCLAMGVDLLGAGRGRARPTR